MINSRNARNLRCGGLFLLACIIVPIFLLGCTGGKSVENNIESSNHVASVLQKDSLVDSRSRDYKHIEKDSTYKLDSVVVMMKGDTIIKDRWHFLKTEKTKTVHLTDTVVKEINHYFSKTDTLKIYKDKKIEVEKKLSWWEDKKMKLGGFSLVASFLFASLYGLERARRKDAEERNG